jgi:Na+-transporting methylmalonyl-CoA/oxaloacetate decarboxylase beta subunit
MLSDNIMVLDKGRIAEIGSHTDLMERAEYIREYSISKMEIKRRYFMNIAADIGIIGGSDGPTRIYVSSHTDWYAIAVIVLAVAAAAVVILREIRRRKR